MAWHSNHGIHNPEIVGVDYRITDDIRPSKLYAAYDM